MKFAVIVFPGSNCDADMLWAVREIMGADAEFVRHDESSLEGFTARRILIWRLFKMWCDCPVFYNHGRSDSFC